VEVVDQLLWHGVPARRQPGDRVNAGGKVPRWIAEAGTLKASEADPERWSSLDQDSDCAQIAVDPVLLGPALMDLTYGGTEVSA
jgi:hypothetical protein